MGTTDAIAGSIWCFGFPIFMCVLMVGMVVPGVALGYGNADFNTTCTANALVPLNTWLLTYGIVSFSSILVVGALLGLAAYCSELNVSSVTMAVTPVWLFHLAWAIVGCVTIWRDSLDCASAAPALFQASEAVVIIELICVFVLCVALPIACFAAS